MADAEDDDDVNETNDENQVKNERPSVAADEEEEETEEKEEKNRESTNISSLPKTSIPSAMVSPEAKANDSPIEAVKVEDEVKDIYAVPKVSLPSNVASTELKSIDRQIKKVKTEDKIKGVSSISKTSLPSSVDSLDTKLNDSSSESTKIEDEVKDIYVASKTSLATDSIAPEKKPQPVEPVRIVAATGKKEPTLEDKKVGKPAPIVTSSTTLPKPGFRAASKLTPTPTTITRVVDTAKSKSAEPKNQINQTTRSKIAKIRAVWKERDSRASQARGTKLGSPIPIPRLALLQGSEPVSTRLEMWEDRTDKSKIYSATTSSRTSVSGPGSKGPSPPKGIRPIVKPFNTSAIAEAPYEEHVATPKPLAPLQQIFKGPNKVEKPVALVKDPFIGVESAKPAVSPKFKANLALNKTMVKLSAMPIKGAEVILKKSDHIPLTDKVPSETPSKNRELEDVNVAIITTVETKESKDLTEPTFPLEPMKMNIKKIGIALPMMTPAAPGIADRETKPTIVDSGAPAPLAKVESSTTKTIAAGAKLNFNPTMMMPPGMGKMGFMSVKDIKMAKATDSSIATNKSDMIHDSHVIEKVSSSTVTISSTDVAISLSAGEMAKAHVPKVASGIANVEKWGALGGAVADIIKVKRGEDPKKGIQADAANTGGETNAKDAARTNGSPMTLTDFEKGSDRSVFNSFKGFSPDKFDFIGDIKDSDTKSSDTDSPEGDVSETADLPDMELHELLQPKLKVKPHKKNTPSKGR